MPTEGSHNRIMTAGGDWSMNEQTAPALASLYEQDETAWLEQTANLVAQRRFGEIDHEHLSEYLSDMARRDKREVFSRLVTLLTHLLKWEYQPEQRSNSWRGTILEQRRELRQLLESGSLRRHAGEVLGKAYQEAIQQAAVETGLTGATFPAECPSSLDELLAPGEGA
jgi:hypothetical protein